MAIYRQVNKWTRLHKKDLTIVRHNTPAGFVYTVLWPSCEALAWMSDRGKHPDLEAMVDRAKLMSARSVLSGE